MFQNKYLKENEKRKIEKKISLTLTIDYLQ